MAYRDCLFRGKRVDNSEWVYGYYVGPCEGDALSYICDINVIGNPMREVISETVGECTHKIEWVGLDASRKTVIFEGDIVEVVGSRHRSNKFEYSSPYDGLWNFRATVEYNKVLMTFVLVYDNEYNNWILHPHGRENVTRTMSCKKLLREYNSEHRWEQEKWFRSHQYPSFDIKVIGNKFDNEDMLEKDISAVKIRR